MRLLLFLLVSLLLVLALGCISSSKGPTGEITGMAVIDSQHINKNTVTNKEQISDCVKYCLGLNKDSSIRSKTGWYMMSPDFCTSSCAASGVKCTVMFSDGSSCSVRCESNNTAFCS